MSSADNPMEIALDLAREAAEHGEVPVGAVIVCDGVVIARSRNTMREAANPTGHAELNAIQLALQAVGSGRLADCDLYVTLEPCTMCAGAIAHAKLRRVYYGAEDPKGGAIDNGVRFFSQPTCHHRPEVIGGVRARDAGELLRKFFADRR